MSRRLQICDSVRSARENGTSIRTPLPRHAPPKRACAIFTDRTSMTSLKFRLSCISLLLLVSISAIGQVPGYGYSRAITIDHRRVANSDQANFPVLISATLPYLATVANGGHVQSTSGYDIIFTSDTAGLVRLDHEIESYDSVGGTAAFWVRIPTLSHAS